jgi:hypothetical protein
MRETVHRRWKDFTDRFVFRRNIKRDIAYRLMREGEEARQKAREEAEDAKRRERIREYEYQQALRLFSIYQGGD